MTCATCPADLTRVDVQQGCRRCLPCRQRVPGRLYPTRRQLQARASPWAAWVLQHPKATVPDGTSWWAAYATGERRDPAFMAQAATEAGVAKYRVSTLRTPELA